ncbi:MAG: rhomboid family intramembrane serine protease [Chthonomonadales bacterium]|nr:rhomboid family intramembrane serine protease [Chthonomonadales bacterium]
MLLPYTSDRPPARPPAAVLTLVLGQFAIFALVALIVAFRGAQLPVLVYANLSVVPGSLRWYTTLTYSLLHESAPHLSVNMLFLWVFGGSVEEATGSWRFLLLYFGSAAATGLIQAAMVLVIPGADPTMPVIGASGAVAAVVGFFAVRFYRARVHLVGLRASVPAISLLTLVLLSEIAAVLWQFALRPGSPGAASAHWAHIAGFAIGMLLAQATRMLAAGRREYLEADARSALECVSPLAAAQRWEDELRANPNDVHAAAELARALARAGEREESVERYRDVLERYLAAGNKRDAVERYLQMRAELPDAVVPARTHLAVACAMEEQGKPEEAAAAYARLAAQHAGSREAEMALLRVGVVHAGKLRDAGRAREALQEFARRYPESAWKDFANQLLRDLERRAR